MPGKNGSTNYYPEAYQNQTITGLELALLLFNPLTIRQLLDLVTGIQLGFETRSIYEDEDPALRFLSLRERASLENGGDLEEAIACSCASRSGSILGEHGRVSLISRDGNSWRQSIHKAWTSYDLQAAGMEILFPFEQLHLSPEIQTFKDLSKIANFSLSLPAQWDEGNVYRFNLFLITAKDGFSLDLRGLEYTRVIAMDPACFEASLSGSDLQEEIIKNQFVNRGIKELINIFNDLDI